MDENLKISSQDAISTLFKASWSFQALESTDVKKDANNTAIVRKLPDELIRHILACSRDSDGTRSLSNCMRVSRKWNEIAAVLLYSDLSVRLTRLPNFPSASVPDKYKPLIQTLSISIANKVPEVPKELLKHASTRQNAMISYFVRRIASFVRELPKLECFSLSIAWDVDSFPFSIYRSDLALVVDALPTSCVNLEIDTRFHDCADETSNESDILARDGLHDRYTSKHLCMVIHKVLPRMKYVRLALNTLCPDLFGRPASLPNLREISIDFIMENKVIVSNGPRTCSRLWAEDAFMSISSHIQDLVARGDIFSPGAKVYLNRISDSPLFEDDRHESWIAIEMISETAVAYPTRIWDDLEHELNNLPLPTLRAEHICAVRLENGVEVIDYTDRNGYHLSYCVQGGVWVALTTGHKFPQFLLDIRRRRSLGWTIPEKQFYLARNPHRIYSIPFGKLLSMTPNRDQYQSIPLVFDRENAVNMLLLRAEVRVGPNAYLSEEGVLEDTPHGWRRTGLGAYIVQDYM